jgi:hypothetical protein
VDFALSAITYPQSSFVAGPANYADTAKATGMQAIPSMNTVASPAFSSAPGLVYSSDGVVPEPARSR